MNNFFLRKVFLEHIYTREIRVLFLNFTSLLVFVGEKDGEIILFVEFGGHGPFLCGFFFRSPVDVDIRADEISQFLEVERFLTLDFLALVVIFPFLTKQNLWQWSVNSSFKLLKLPKDQSPRGVK